jgi:hypothetical protein
MRRLAWVLFIAAALLVIRGSPRASMSEVLQTEGRKPILSTFEGGDIVEEPLTEREAAFAEEFPGRIGRYTSGGKVVILRETDRATHRVHSAATCLAASGWSVEPLPMARLDSGEWSHFRAEKGGESLLVREQIRAADGSTLPDVPSWFWSALLGRTKGPWVVMTVVECE